MKTINIMTACDEGYAKYILPQLVSMNKHLSEYDVHFYLLYNRITSDTIRLINDFCDNYPKLNFHPIFIDKDIDKFSEIASGGGGGQTGKSLFPYEVYFLLDCHNYLPKSVDRVFYIHSADIILFDDISEYYFSDFNDKALTVEISNSRIYKDAVDCIPNFKDERPVLLSVDDRPQFIEKNKLDSAAFNSGTFMINVEKFRDIGYTLNYFLDIKNEIATIHSDITDGKYYEGDQAFFTIAFLGNINSFYLTPDKMRNFREYNYSPVVKFWRKKLNYSVPNNPKIIHYDSLVKPWQMTQDFFVSGIPSNVNDETFLSNLHFFSPIGLQKYYEQYWDYVKETPIYDEMHKEAEYLSKVYKKTYLPTISRLVTSNEDKRKYYNRSIQLDTDLKVCKKSLRYYKDKYNNIISEIKIIKKSIKLIEKRQADTFLKKIKRRIHRK